MLLMSSNLNKADFALVLDFLNIPKFLCLGTTGSTRMWLWPDLLFHFFRERTWECATANRVGDG